MKYLTRKDYNMFDNFWDTMLKPINSNNMKTDISETDKNYLFAIDMPGYDKSNINIEVENGYLTVSAKREEEKEENQNGYVYRERSLGNCQRSYYLGEVSDEGISAKYENGTLTIDIPKREKIDTTKRIQIS